MIGECVFVCLFACVVFIFILRCERITAYLCGRAGVASSFTFVCAFACLFASAASESEFERRITKTHPHRPTYL